MTTTAGSTTNYDRIVPSTSRPVLRLRITLEESEPEIWRTFDVDPSLTLADLHDAIQLIMGWRNSHLHEFTEVDRWDRSNGIPRIGRAPRVWGMTDIDAPEEVVPDTTVTIAEAFDHDGPLYYQYDFGDSWNHRLELIERGTTDAGESPVNVVHGERRCPYEDAGGMHGYAEKLAVMADPTHPDHEFITEWVNATLGPWRTSDPEHFDAAAVQRGLDRRFGAGEGSIPSLSLLGTYLERLPASLGAELTTHLEMSGAFDLPRPTITDMAEVLTPLQWLIDTVGLEGIPLSKAGWMPPAVVREGMTTLGWARDWMRATSEATTPPLRNLRESAMRMGIVRKFKGRLVLGAEAKKSLGDIERLWDLTAARVLRGLDASETDAGLFLLMGIADGTITARNDGWQSIVFGLECLGWSMPDPEGFTQSTIRDLTVPLTWVLRDLQVLGDSYGAAPREAHSAARAFARDTLLR